MRKGTYDDLLYCPPSLIQGERLNDVRKIAKAAYRHGYTDALRMNRAGRLVEDDPFLNTLRERVEEIRKEKIIKGEIEPITRQERKWRLGL